MRHFRNILPVTAVFIAVFFLLRNLPATKCAFLHYAEVYNPVTGETELCAVAPAEYIDLVSHPFPVELEFVDPPEGRADAAAAWTFHLLDPGGRPFMAHEIGITHTERIHCLLVDETREHYLHLHPVVDETGSRFTLEVPPLPAGEWVLFTEFVPRETRRVAMTRTTFSIRHGAEAGGLGADQGRIPRLELTTNGEGVSFKAGRDYRMILTVRSPAAGEAVRLEKVMDAYAHLVAFDGAVRGYVHMHPLIESLDGGEEATMEFLFHPPRPGDYRVWVQIQYSGSPFFRAFDFEVL